jgi:hypothetical protein
MRFVSMVPCSARLGLCGFVAVAALVALAPGRADAGSMYVHSASSGELVGGRLTLHGVGRRVSWTATDGSVGVARITRAHRRLFSPETPATGTLHIAGQRGGQELALRLSKPHYSAARRTVSYRAKPLAKRTAAASAAATAPRRFGAASLSVVPHHSLGGTSRAGGNNCRAGYINDTWYGMTYVSSDKWDTDTWEFDSNLVSGFVAGSTNLLVPVEPPGLQFDGTEWESDGGLWRGCANHTSWTFVTDPDNPDMSGIPPADITIDFNLEWDWTQLPSFSCASSDPRFTCALERKSQRWHVIDTQRPPR